MRRIVAIVTAQTQRSKASQTRTRPPAHLRRWRTRLSSRSKSAAKSLKNALRRDSYVYVP